ncbi:MAG: hypothetical protein R2711_10620 [Acidimicrobiales bacterium]
MTTPIEPPSSTVGGVRTTRRRGRTSAAKASALRDLLPRFQATLDPSWPRAADVTGRAGVAADIGVGDGLHRRSPGPAPAPTCSSSRSSSTAPGSPSS